MITLVNVFQTTFEFHTAPGVVQFHIRQLVQRWGADLDATAPVCVRVAAFLMMRRWGVPGTPF